MWSRLMRHYGYQKLAYGLLAYLISGVVLWIVGSGEPRGWPHWPSQAREATILLCSGLHKLAVLLWVWWITRPLIGFGKNGRWTMLAVFGLAMLSFGGPGSSQAFKGVLLWLGGREAAVGPIGWQVFRVVIIPTGIAAVVAMWPDITVRLRSNPTWRRAFISGEGHAAGWASAPTVARQSKPLPDSPPEGTGHVSDGIYLGRTQFESSYIGGRDVWLRENSHLGTIAMTGSGKLISSIAPTACLYPGSAVMVSPKPELADTFCGRRTDPRYFEASRSSRHRLGVDPRGISKARFHLRGGRVFILDPSGQSVYPSSRHNFLSEIDLNDDNARSLIFAIAKGIVPDNPRASEPFWINCCSGFLAAGIGDTLTRYDDPRAHTLPFVVDRLMGIDPKERRADPAVFRKTLVSMMQNPALGGFIQANASTVMQLGDRAFGSVNAELGNYVRWITDPQMRRHLSGPSDFSYREFGDDRHPITAFLVPPRIAMQEALPFLRVHAELSLQLFATRTNRPAIPTLFLCDEFRQYGERIRAIRDGATILRDARVKLWLFAQSWPSLVDTIGEAGANEFASCSAMQYYGIDDIETAERISRELGKSTKRVGGRLSGKPISEQVYDVVTPAEVMTELRKNAPLQYVFPTTSAPMRLSRVAHKPIVTEEGGRFQSLPLAGHFDDGLSRFTIGNRGA